MKKILMKGLLVSFILALSAASFFYGYYSRNRKNFADKLVREAHLIYLKVKGEVYFQLDIPDEELGPDLNYGGQRPEGQFNDLSRLAALPYLQGSIKAPEVSNVTVYKKDKAYNGLNFYVSGHKPSAFLIDMEGDVIHEWSLAMKKAWPRYYDLIKHGPHKMLWRRAHFLDNGDLLAIYEGIGIIKIDKESNLIWANPCRAHHSIFIHENGNVYTLTRNRVKPDYESEFSPYFPKFVLEDFITVLSPDGNIIKKISILKSFLNSDFATVLSDGITKVEDILHTNSIEVLDGSLEDKVPMFKKGLILISMRHKNVIALIDPEKEKVVWVMYGLWRGQHEPVILEDGAVMVFDNLGRDKKSKVVEFNPMTQEILWQYRGTNENPFYTERSGSNRRLPNGNTLITESGQGRAFEVTRDHELVWEFYNPHRAGDRNELIATLFEVIRVDPAAIHCQPGPKPKCFNP